MRNSITLLTLSLTLGFMSCKDHPAKPETSKESQSQLMQTNALVPVSWVTKRVENAKAKLEKTEAGRIVWNAMEAHGGLLNWYNNGPLSFRFNYQPLDGSTQRDSYQTIDSWSNRAKHTSVLDSMAHFGWTGKTAWVKAKDSTAFKYDTRFWALTPFYFLAQPFVLDGEGVNLELLPEVVYEDTKQNVIKVTFDSGTGDAPDDYYVLYFDKEDSKLNVIRYIVSYPAYFKDGGHLPEKFMEVIGENTVNGILFPTSYKTYWLTDDEKPGEYITKIDVSDIHYKIDLEEDYFDMPQGAKVIEAL